MSQITLLLCVINPDWLEVGESNTRGNVLFKVLMPLYSFFILL